jgi:hypothetical protein
MLSRLNFVSFSFVFKIGLISLFLICIILFSLSKCFGREIEKDRTKTTEELRSLLSLFEKNPQDEAVRLKLAKTLFELGDFTRAKDITVPLLKKEQPETEAKKLMAYIEYVTGNFSQAEKLILEVLERTKNNLNQRIEAEIALVYIYYQTLQYEKTSVLFKGLEGKIKLPHWEQMKSFKNEKPYQIEWKKDKKVEVPFLVSDPLPVVQVEFQGKKIYVIIDTGGEAFYLDWEAADSLGIKPITKVKSDGFAGEKEAEVGYAKADCLKIGDVTIKSIPVVLTPIRRSSAMLTGGKYPISGILSTGDLRQFISTIDYPNEKLILRPKTEEGRLSLERDLKGRKVTKVHFALGITHLITVKASVNGKYPLNLFLDSGLADSEASVAFPKQTLNYLGIPIPKTEILPEDLGGPGGGGFPIGKFDIDELEIGPLVQKDLKGYYGVFPSSIYFVSEFIIDGIVSHNFLKKYSWTIDFSRMEMIFAY